MLTITTHKVMQDYYGATIRVQSSRRNPSSIIGTEFGRTWYEAFMLAAEKARARGLLKTLTV